jgi:hypothetical protein
MKRLVLKNWLTNQYFTARYGAVWDLSLAKAYWIPDEEIIPDVIKDFKDDFLNLDYIIIETIYII